MKSITKATTTGELMLAGGMAGLGLCGWAVGLNSGDISIMFGGGLALTLATMLILARVVSHQTHIAKEEILKEIRNGSNMD